MLTADLLIRTTSDVGYGRVTGIYADHADMLDRRARIMDLSPTVTAFEEFVEGFVDDATDDAKDLWTFAFGSGPRGLVAALLDAQVDLWIPGISVPIHTNTSWRLEFSDTETVKVPAPALRCRGRDIVLDYGQLLALEALDGFDINQIMSAWGEVIAADNSFVIGLSEFITDRAGELVDLPGECNLVPDNLLDLFSIIEIVNWSLVTTPVRVPALKWVPTGKPVSDGEMDTDGLVHSSSALGFSLGTSTPLFFDHTRNERIGRTRMNGSWYRLPDGPSEEFNHGLQYQPEVGAWIRKTLLTPEVGPVPDPVEKFSVWPAL